MNEAVHTQHLRRMQRRKMAVDAAISRATEKRGVLIVLTGNGKGKSSSAFGMVARALGHGMKVAVFQFIKGRSDTGEEACFRRDPHVLWLVCGQGFTWETQSREKDIAAAEAGWALARKALQDPSIGLVVLDELTYLLKYGYLDLGTVLDDLLDRPPGQHVVVTGRGAPPELLGVADTVSAVANVKHAFDAGIAAQAGIDL